MSDEPPAEPISRKRVLYTIAGMDDVVVQRVPYRTVAEDSLTLDVYAPPNRNGCETLPAMILVTGYSDAGARRMFDCSFSEMGSFVSWARLMAASGLIAVTYTNEDPRDVRATIDYVRQHAAELGIDGDRVGVWSCSGHAPNALSLLMEASGSAPRCAVLCYPYTMDVEPSTLVSDAAKRWGFLNACAGRSVADLSRDIPLFLVRAGDDQMPGLNAALDRFVAEGLVRNLPITLVNHARASHAFDLFHDSLQTRAIIEATLRFMQVHLGGSTAAPRESVPKVP